MRMIVKLIFSNLFFLLHKSVKWWVFIDKNSCRPLGFNPKRCASSKHTRLHISGLGNRLHLLVIDYTVQILKTSNGQLDCNRLHFMCNRLQVWNFQFWAHEQNGNRLLNMVIDYTVPEFEEIKVSTHFWLFVHSKNILKHLLIIPLSNHVYMVTN